MRELGETFALGELAELIKTGETFLNLGGDGVDSDALCESIRVKIVLCCSATTFFLSCSFWCSRATFTCIAATVSILRAYRRSCPL